ncbi:MAG TPA: MFS transporter [Steroidobacteraceae bacterium]|nr:MFS transporter [Steroidobacteraceae bacterium]
MNTPPARDNSFLGFLDNPSERKIVISGFFLLFCVLGGYFAVRPVRETIGTILGREATQNLWGFTALFAILIVPFYGWLVARVRRAVLLPAIYGFMALGFIVAAVVFENDPKNQVLARCFYVGISVMNLLLVSVFWSFMLEILSSRQTKRLFGIIAAGGTAGAFIGPLITSLIVTRVGNSGILYLGAGMFIIAVFLQRVLIAQWRSLEPEAGTASTPAQLSEKDRALGGNPFAGVMLVLRSPYLIGIMLFVVGVSAINTFLYFEQLKLVEDQFEEIAKRTQVFANLDTIVQGLVIFTQLFLTGFIATRFGLTLLLVMVPVVMIFGLTVFALSGTFIVLAVAMVIRRWGEYAFIRPGREMLFSKVDKESKYKAKNLIDVAVYRIADAGFAQLKKFLEAIGMTGTVEALFTAGIAALWAFNGWWLGRRHDREKN